MKLLPVFFACVAYLLLLAAFFLCRSVPSAHLWSGYDALYIDAGVPEEEVVARLGRAGCDGVVFSGAQRVPDVSPMAPVQPGAVNGSEYIALRMKYFSDRSGSYRIYYVPSHFRSKAVSAARAVIADYKVAGGFDSGGGFQWICVIVVALAVCLLAFYAENRREFLALSAMPAVYSCCFPFYVCAAAAVFLLFPLFAAQRLLYRQRFFEALGNSRYVSAFAVLPVPFVFAETIRGGLFFLLAAAGCALCAVALRALRAWTDSRRSFAPVFILNACLVNPVPRRRRIFMTVPAAAGGAVLLFCAVSGGAGVHAGDSAVQLPAPSASALSGEGMPVFSDYLAWCWSALSLPYKSLNGAQNVWSGAPHEGDSVSLRRYYSEDGAIRSRDEVVMTYDAVFERRMADAVVALTYPAIEKVLLANSSALSAVYSIPGKASASGRSIVILVILTAVPAAIYLFGRKHEVSV